MPANKDPGSYGEAWTAARGLLNRGRLADPGEHYPYKRADVQQLIDDDPPMGPGTPGELDGSEDRRLGVADFMTPEIADASKDYIDAQAAYLENPAEDTKQAYDAARDVLQAARLDHRQDRGDGFTVTAARRAR
jgi:hypothetical protein